MEQRRIEHSKEILSELPKGNDVLLQSEIMNKIIIEIYNGWPGLVGKERAVSVVGFIYEMVPQYAKVLGKSELETLELMAKARKCTFVNYFKKSNFPDLMDVYVFNAQEDYYSEFPSKKFICPCCEGISTNPEVCNSGKLIDNGRHLCNWKAYGLFGTMNKGIHVLFKNKFGEIPMPIEIFKPIELLELEIET